MGADSHHPALDARTLRLIRRKARQLIGKYGFTPDDRDDIEQELTLDLLRRLPHFDPARSRLEDFIARRLDNAVARLIEHRRALKRDCPFDLCSLYEVAARSEEGEVLHAELAQEDALRTLSGTTRRSPEEETDLRTDLARALALMSPEQRAICRALLHSDLNKKQLAKRLGISRDTLYERLREIRRICERLGLGQDL